MAIEDIEIGKAQKRQMNGVVVVILEATPQRRDVHAEIIVDNVVLAQGIAVDNAGGQSRSVALSTITAPVPHGVEFQVNAKNGGATARWVRM